MTSFENIPQLLFVILAILPSPFVQVFGYFGDHHEVLKNYGIQKDPFAGRCNRKSKDVSACIHKYLEKDFISLSPIVYPKVRTPDTQCVNSEEFERKHKVLMDGPTLQNSCNDLHHVLDCMFEQLNYCTTMDTFLQLRHLHYSLKKLSHWLCGERAQDGQEMSDQHSSVRTRFLGLLESVKCMECVRVNHPGCLSLPTPSPEDDISLWHKVLRMEIGMERCHPIKQKMKCIQNDAVLLRICGQKASDLHKNLTDIFVSTWCDSAPFVISISTSINSKGFTTYISLLFGIWPIFHI